jgi:hypothetical protein
MKLRVSADLEIDPSQLRDGKASELWVQMVYSEAFQEFFEETGLLNSIMTDRGLIPVECKNVKLYHVVEKPAETVPEGWSKERLRRIQLVRCTLCNAGRGERCRNKNSEGLMQAMSVPHVARYDRAIQQGTIGPMEVVGETQDQHRT